MIRTSQLCQSSGSSPAMSSSILDALRSWEAGGRERLGAQFTTIQSESEGESAADQSSLTFQSFLLQLLSFAIASNPSYSEPATNNIRALLVACLDCTTRSSSEASSSAAQQTLASAIWLTCKHRRSNQSINQSIIQSVNQSSNHSSTSLDRSIECTFIHSRDSVQFERAFRTID